jgi:hypothetical protein
MIERTVGDHDLQHYVVSTLLLGCPIRGHIIASPASYTGLPQRSFRDWIWSRCTPEEAERAKALVVTRKQLEAQTAR